MKELLGWIKDLLVALLIAAILLILFKPIIIHQTSMEPNFHEGNYIIVSRQAYRFKEPARGDVVVFQSDLTTETGKSKLLIKRIIGLPGEEVAITDGYVYINGEKIQEDYVIMEGASGEMKPNVVPDGCYFVCGDNRINSADSRDPRVGFVEKDRFLGRVALLIFPFKQFGLIK